MPIQPNVINVLKTDLLNLERCPHCGIHLPRLSAVHSFETRDTGHRRRVWVVYACSACGKSVNAWADDIGQVIREIFPTTSSISEDIPTRAREYLTQAKNSISQPSGSVMLSASAIDAMLKEKGFTTDNLFKRINHAVEANVLTPEMGKWAHEVRLDANDERHADLNSELPTQEEAEKTFEFAMALSELLFILPARIQRGITSTTAQSTE